MRLVQPDSADWPDEIILAIGSRSTLWSWCNVFGKWKVVHSTILPTASVCHYKNICILLTDIYRTYHGTDLTRTAAGLFRPWPVHSHGSLFPDRVRNPNSSEAEFRRLLKTFLFTQDSVGVYTDWCAMLMHTLTLTKQVHIVTSNAAALLVVFLYKPVMKFCEFGNCISYCIYR